MPGKTFASSALPAAFVHAHWACPQAPPAALAIHADQPVSAVSPTPYGLMTEEINFSYGGGLYAEMVRNRTFRSSWEGVQYRYSVENGLAQAKMEHDSKAGPSEALTSSLRTDVEQANGSNQPGC